MDSQRFNYDDARVVYSATTVSHVYRTFGFRNPTVQQRLLYVVYGYVKFTHGLLVRTTTDGKYVAIKCPPNGTSRLSMENIKIFNMLKIAPRKNRHRGYATVCLGTQQS